MSQIEISCIGQTAIFTNTPEIFSGDIGVDTVKFTFDELWDSYRIKTAVFYNNSKETYTVILDENNVAVIPEEVMADKCKLNIGVFGTNANGDVKTSKIITYHIGKGAISNDLESPTTTPDLWVQILARQTNFENRIDSKVDALSNNVDTLSDDVETLEGIAKGRNQALAYTSYSEMITALNSMDADELNRGQNIYIATVGVPDLWVYGVETENVEYTYVDDLTFLETMDANDTIQVGHYKLAQLETQKVDLISLNNDIDALERTIGYVKSKNYIRYPYDDARVNTTTNISGLSYIVDGDGVVTINGTSKEIGGFVLNNSKSVILPKGTYIVSGCPSGGSNTTYSIRIWAYDDDDNVIYVAENFGGETTFTLEKETALGVQIRCWAVGVVFNNTVFKPMIREASIKDDTYEPYVADVQTQLNTIFTSVDYTIQTTSNSSASPYTKYGELDISSHINAYGTPISINASNSSGIPVPCSYSTGSKKMKVCSNLGEIYAKIVYVKIPVTAK